MFVLCVDKGLKETLIQNGFKLLKETDKGWLFLFDNKIKFNFDAVSKNKFIFTNRLTF